MRLLLIALLPCGLLAQSITQVGPLEYQPSRQDVSTRTVNRKPSSFEQQLPAPLSYRLGTLRQAEIDAVTRDPLLPLRGVERVIDRRNRLRGQWITLDNGTTVWRLAIQSEGALGVRVQFSGFAVGDGSVWVYSEDRSQVYGPYAGTGIDETGEFWSNTVFGDQAIVEYQPDTPRSDVPFTIAQVMHLMKIEQAMAAGSCELDVSCYADWNAIASGVGMYIYQKGGGTYACSGALLNNSKNDRKPYFLTANHCISDAASAKTVNVFWKFQTPSCNGKAPALASLPQTLGATYLASAGMGSGDYSLILLTPLPTTTALTFYGWNGASTALQIGDKTTGIHHPSADYTRIAFGVRDPDMAAQVGSEFAPASMFYQVRETSGRIEPGSSGSPLFTADKVVVGTLTYGPGGNACTISPFSAGYGRFSAALPALTSYLSPSATTTPPAATGATVTTTPTSVKAGWSLLSVAPAAQNVQVTTTSAAALAIAAKSNQTWITLSATSLSVSQSKPATLGVTINVPSLTAVGSYTGTITLTGTGISQTIPVQVDVTAPSSPVKGGPVSVIPLFLDGSGSTTTFTIINPYATSTMASISFLAGNGTALTVPTASQTASWQNVTIPAWGTATVTTTGSSTPQKSGFALVQSSDAGKRVRAWGQINADAIPPAVPLTPPFAMPFDATSTSPSTLYLFNPAASGTLTLNLTVYDPAGVLIGTGQITIPAQVEGSIPMTKTAAVFGGRKGTLYIDGKGPVTVLGVRTGSDGRLSAILPQ